MKNYLIFICGFLLISCGEGFNPSPKNGLTDLGSQDCVSNCDDQNPDDSDDTDNVNTPAPELDGKVSGGIWDGEELLKLDLENQSLLVRVPIDFEADIVAGSFPIPGESDLTLEFVTDDDNSKHLQLRVPLSRLLGSTKLPTSMGLPNGDGLPMVSGGKLPHVQTKLGKTEVHFYMGSGVLGLFVPTGFNPFISLVFPIKNNKKEVLGHFATVAEKGNFNGGFYVSVQLPKELKDAIDTWLPIIAN